MTFNRDKGSDRIATARVLAEIAAGTNAPNDVPNWLGHTKGAAKIDSDLLHGTTMLRMRTHRGGVKDHLRHLSLVHGLTVIERNGVFRLLVLPEVD